MKRPVEKIWLPGQGVVDLAPMKIHRAVQAYDDRLMFGRNEDTGDWCVFAKMGPSANPLPVIGFGPHLPSDPDEVVRRVDAANTLKHAAKIFGQIMADDERRRKQYEPAAEDAAQVAAEVIDYELRKRGDHPFPRIFVPRGI